MTRHVLALIGEASVADGVMMAARAVATSTGARLTVVAVAVIEDERRGCCDLRSGLWNRMQRELAAEQLRTAEQRLAPAFRAAFRIAEGSSVEDALVREANAGDYDVMIVPEDRRSWLRRKPGLADRLGGRVPCHVLPLRAVIFERGTSTDEAAGVATPWADPRRRTCASTRGIAGVPPGPQRRAFRRG